MISRKFKTPIIGSAGWKKSGKTTLTVRLVEEFTRRGFKVAVEVLNDGRHTVPLVANASAGQAARQG